MGLQPGAMAAGRLLLFLLLLGAPPASLPAPPTCYSRVLALSYEISEELRGLQATQSSEPCVTHLTQLRLDVHNYCVLTKLRDLASSPHCWGLDSLRDKARKLYTMLTTFCRRDLVFLLNDCSALEFPATWTTAQPASGG